MGKIKDILIDIQERLEAGENPVQIARALAVPLDWVLGAETEMDGDWSDFTRIVEDPGYTDI
jgi:hypothetical protein